jgi:succinate-acetate transporter protein
VYWYRYGFIVGGLVSVAFGVVLFARPNVGAVTVALLFGLFSLIYGVSQIVMGHRAAQDWANPAAGPAQRDLRPPGRRKNADLRR